MPEFKLISITPLKGCNSDFSKKLRTGHSYQFYSNYTIKSDRECNEILYAKNNSEEEAPENLYSLENGIFLSISAVIGKNGTGKSTLMELLYQAVYMLATRGNYYGERLLEKPSEQLARESEELQGVLKGLTEQFSYLNFADYHISTNVKPIHQRGNDVGLQLIELIRRYELDVRVENLDHEQKFVKRVASNLAGKIADLARAFEDEDKKDQSLDSSFNISILYEAKGTIKEIEFRSGHIRYFEVFGRNRKKEIHTAPKLEDFFYTISLNYSHHGLNSHTVGRWVNKLFHKNDAYRTPLVLNPMRKNGNFDINHEIKLSNERLMSTLVYDLVNNRENWILDKYKIASFIFVKKYPYLHNLVNQSDLDLLPYAFLVKGRYKIGTNSLNLPNAQLALSYMSRKIGRVAGNYGFLFNNTNDPNQDLETFLENEDSHITKKIKQTANYLTRSAKELNPIWNSDKFSQPWGVVLPPEKLLEYINLFQPEKGLGPAELIEFALPSFFNIDFIFEDKDGKTVKLSDMSSGEQQMIFNINAIMYHLYNLESVHKNDRAFNQPNRKRPIYSYVNVVLDEMELYYHPEMQRRFVFDLIGALNKLKKDKIRGVNICILTHSPFILSDMPLQNILRLTEKADKGSSDTHQTFAANIHELLRKEFMLEKGFVGEYSRIKIEQVIYSLKIYAVMRQSSNARKIRPFNVEEMREKLNPYPDLANFNVKELLGEKECENFIALVGEPVLYESLVEFYSQVFPEKKKDFIESQIAMLKKMKNANNTR